ncbi:MAG: helix-turn-helix domain-containing protein [Anaerovoracaceae bacterium]
MTDTKYKKIFSENLNFYMKKNDKTQNDLMHDLNLGSSTVSYWCNGKALPRMSKVQLLADYLGINKSDLLEERTTDYYIDPTVMEMANQLKDNPGLRVLFDAAKDVSPEELQAIVTLINIKRG